MENDFGKSENKIPLWLWCLMGIAIVVAFVSAHFYYGSILYGFVIVVVELLIAAIHLGVIYAWRYFFD